jgi:subtilisin family serine protease
MNRSAVVICTIVAGSSLIVSGQGAAATWPSIVVFDDAVSLQGFEDIYAPDERARANPAAWSYLRPAVAGAVQSLERRHGFRADQIFSATIRGFAARLTLRQILELEANPLVAYIEADGSATILSQTLPWGIDRVDADLSATMAGNNSGGITNVNVYVIDTGIDTAHADLHVTRHVKFASGPNRDCNGHGTHIAGTISAKDNTDDVVGIAPGAPLTGVKVLGCDGSGTISAVIKGIDWVTANATLPAIANLSLGSKASTSLDDAVRRSAAAGIFYAIAAGNSGADACNTSPARAGAGADNGIVTTAASDSDDEEASWSNYGSCIDIWAPGVGILSTARGGGTTIMSGTSMASPHSGGAAALYLSGHPAANPTDVEMMLKTYAQPTTTSKDGRVVMRLWVAAF